MKNTCHIMLVGVMALVPVTRAVDRVVITEAVTGVGSLTAAINALNDGDRIVFHIPPEAGEVHYIQTPPDGFPLITRNNITIDGGTQGGASPNTASIHEANNAVLKIVLSSTNGNALSMYTACSTFAGVAYPKFGFGDGEQAVLGFFRASNVWVKAIAFLAAPQTSTSQEVGGDCKTICFAVDAPDVSQQACQNFHVSGCWFGVDPITKQVAYMPDGTTLATPTICIATYGTGTNGTPGFPNTTLYPGPGTIGVAAGSTNPRAEFNVFVTGYGFDSQGGPFRVCGNFWNVLPDGVTLADISALNGGAQEGDAFVEFGSGHDIVIGTDGDGVNDADEGNIFGSYANTGRDIYYYGSQGSTVIAGNIFGEDIHGNSFGVGQTTTLVHHFNHDSTCAVRFGSDFNGVSDALEANTVADAYLFDIDIPSGGFSHWISMRGNSLTNTTAPSISRPPLGDGQGDIYGQQVYAQFIDISGAGGTMDLIPVIGTGTTTTTLTGTCGKRAARFIRVVLDLYEADTTPSVPPQGKKWLGRFMENSTADSNPAEGAFTFDITNLGIAHGTQVTIAATYIVDGPTISSVSRSGGNTTLTISGGTPPYDIYGSTTVDGTYTLVSTSASTTATFAAPANMSFYYLVYHPQISSGSGQTSPFSDLFTIP